MKLASNAVKERDGRDQVELSAAIQRVMREKKLTAEELRKRLGVSAHMLRKIICGEVVRSSHLEKQMIEVLEIKPDRVQRSCATPAEESQCRAGARFEKEKSRVR